MEDSNTTITPGALETVAQPDMDILNAMQGDNAPAQRHAADLSLDGSYVPAEGKLYTEYMNIGYGVGFGAEIGCAAGALVLGKKDTIAQPKTPLTCIIVKARGFWREWKNYEEGNPAKEFATELDARKAGFRTVNPPYGSGRPLRNCAPATHLLLFVQAPKEGAGTSLAFNILLNGRAYAPVNFTVDKKQYAEIEKTLDQLPKLDAATRGVPPDQGRLSAYYVTLSTRPEVVKNPNNPDPQKRSISIVHLNLNPALGPDNRPLRVEDKVKADLAALAAQIAAVAAGSAAPVGELGGGTVADEVMP